MSKLTIAQEKAVLRSRLLRQRAGLIDRAARDTAIARRILMYKKYLDAENIFIYISKPDEVDTKRMIRHSLQSGKRLFAPRCIPGGMQMRFFRFLSPDELLPGSFGVWEPDPIRCQPAQPRDCVHALCLVPGLAFDSSGARLGYGKGYYDRFLTENRMFSVGICYDSFLLDRIPVGPYDSYVNAVATDEKLLLTDAGKE